MKDSSNETVQETRTGTVRSEMLSFGLYIFIEVSSVCVCVCVCICVCVTHSDVDV